MRKKSYSNHRVSALIDEYIHSARNREILQDKYDSAVRELAKVQTENAVKAQTEYLLGVMGKWIANAPAVA